MPPGAIMQHIDVAQIAFWTFFLVFLGLVYYLRREDKREGYPLVNPGGHRLIGFPTAPDPVTMVRYDGTSIVVPHDDPDPPIAARKLFPFPGAPLTPIGNPLTSALGPSTYTMREDIPFYVTDGTPQVLPLRIATGWSVMKGDIDPRGMRVLDVRYHPVGVVRDIWVDRGVKILRYLEIVLDGDTRDGTVLLPIYHCDIDERERDIRVTALHDTQFAAIPRLKSPDQITAREEDQVNGYYAGGRFHINEPFGDAL